jgi:NAD-dependent DNA ligase
MALKTAQAFVTKIDDFLVFLQECGLQNKLSQKNISLEQEFVDISHPLYKKMIVMTGIRDPIIIDSLKKVGANLGSSVSKNTFLVIAKTTDEDTGKAAEARKMNIPILTPAQFMAKYF